MTSAIGDLHTFGLISESVKLMKKKHAAAEEI